MVHRYLKTCVLSVCVAALCGGRAFGVMLWCEECEEYISHEAWGYHRDKKHHGIPVGPKSFRCSKCLKRISVGDWKRHAAKEHSELYFGCYFWCAKCEEPVLKSIWFFHLWKHIENAPIFRDVYWERCRGFFSESKNYKSNYTIGSTGFVECRICSKAEGRMSKVLQEERCFHILDEHSNRLPKYDLYCELCKTAVSENGWNDHVKEKHKNDFSRSVYVCPECHKHLRGSSGKEPMEEVHKHMEEVHSERENSINLRQDPDKAFQEKETCHSLEMDSNPFTEVNEELDMDLGMEKSEVKCPWFLKGCSFKGIPSDCEAHVREKHKCTRKCHFDTQATFIHGKSCENRCFTKCLDCDAADVDKSHFVEKHGCVEGCLFLSGEERWHRFVECKGWLLKECKCGQRDVRRRHVREHFPECAGLCTITQDQEGFVYMQHKFQNHVQCKLQHQYSKEGWTFVGMQQGHITEEEGTIKSTINED